MEKEDAGKGVVDQARVCPKCHGPAVDYSEMAGGEASCRNGACGWRGRREELVVIQFSHQFADQQEMLRHMSKDLRNTIARSAAQDFGRFLVKWGFLSQPLQPREMARYFAAMAVGIVKAIFEERQKILEETSGRRDAKSEPS